MECPQEDLRGDPCSNKDSQKESSKHKAKSKYTLKVEEQADSQRGTCPLGSLGIRYLLGLSGLVAAG